MYTASTLKHLAIILGGLRFLTNARVCVNFRWEDIVYKRFPCVLHWYQLPSVFCPRFTATTLFCEYTSQYVVLTHFYFVGYAIVTHVTVRTTSKARMILRGNKYDHCQCLRVHKRCFTKVHGWTFFLDAEVLWLTTQFVSIDKVDKLLTNFHTLLLRRCE